MKNLFLFKIVEEKKHFKIVGTKRKNIGEILYNSYITEIFSGTVKTTWKKKIETNSCESASK